MPILGEIPLMKDRDGEQAIVVEENKTSSVAESFRLLIAGNETFSLARHSRRKHNDPCLRSNEIHIGP